MRRRIGRVDEVHLGAIMCKTLLGMRYLNQSHVVHRDIKPSNILINTRGQVKLCDFGTSKILLEKTVSGVESVPGFSSRAHALLAHMNSMHRAPRLYDAHNAHWLT